MGNPPLARVHAHRTRADADLSGGQTPLDLGDGTWVMVVAAIRRSVRLACRSLPLRWWEGRRFGANHEPASHKTHRRERAGHPPGFGEETLFLL